MKKKQVAKGKLVKRAPNKEDEKKRILCINDSLWNELKKIAHNDRASLSATVRKLIKEASANEKGI